MPSIARYTVLSSDTVRFLAVSCARGTISGSGTCSYCVQADVVLEIPAELLAHVQEWLGVVVRHEVARALAQVDVSAQQPYLSTHEAAQFARVTAGTVRRWIDEGRLTRHSSGRRVLVSRVELKRLVRADGKRQPPRAKRRRETATPEERAERMLGLR